MAETDGTGGTDAETISDLINFQVFRKHSREEKEVKIECKLSGFW